MHKKFFFLLVFTVICAINLMGCAPFHYTKPDDLWASCRDAARKKWSHYSTSCTLLKEISFKDYKRALAAGNAWIEAHNLDYQHIQNIRRGTVWIGMPADAAKLAWGAPRIVVTKTQALQNHQEWKYASGNSLLINDGKVTGILN